MSILRRLKQAVVAALMTASVCVPVAGATELNHAVPQRTCASLMIRDSADLRVGASCTDVAGNLWIERSNFTELKRLSNLRSVTGMLVIAGNTQLESLDLSNLRAVGNLVVMNNASLTSLGGLNRLQSASAVTIWNNAALEDLRGLSRLKRLDGLAIGENGLFTVEGLNNLRKVRDLVIVRNRRLINLVALSGLERVYNLDIAINPALGAAEGLLESVERVSGSLTFRGNSGMSSTEVNAFLTRVRPPWQVASGTGQALSMQ